MTENTITSEISESVKISIGKISLVSESILRIDVKDCDEITTDNLHELVKTIKELGNGRSFCNLIVMHHFVTIDPKSLEYSASNEGNIYTIADAFVINSSALKLIGNFYMKISKPVKPTRIFNNELEALEWLQTFY